MLGGKYRIRRYVVREAFYAVHQLVYAAAYAIVLWKTQLFVLPAICVCHIMVLAEIHGQLSHKFILWKVVYQVGKIACYAAETLKREHLIVVKNLFHCRSSDCVLRLIINVASSRSSAERHTSNAVIYSAAATVMRAGSSR